MYWLLQAHTLYVPYRSELQALQRPLLSWPARHGMMSILQALCPQLPRCMPHAGFGYTFTAYALLIGGRAGVRTASNIVVATLPRIAGCDAGWADHHPFIHPPLRRLGGVRGGEGADVGAQPQLLVSDREKYHLAEQDSQRLLGEVEERPWGFAAQA